MFPSLDVGLYSVSFFFLKTPYNQPFVRDYMVRNHSARFESAFGQRRAKSMMEATAGSMIGVGEVRKRRQMLWCTAVVRATAVATLGAIYVCIDDRLRRTRMPVAPKTHKAHPTLPSFHVRLPPPQNNEHHVNTQHNACARATRTQIALLPLDVLKIKAQTNPESLAGRGVADIFLKEGRGLYRGAGWTAARNAPGSFALFGGASVVKEYVFKLERPGDATLFQTFCASIAGAVSRCVVSACISVRVCVLCV